MRSATSRRLEADRTRPVRATPAADAYREAVNRFCRSQEERIFRYSRKDQWWCKTVEGHTVPTPFKTKKLASEYLDGSDMMILNRLREAKEREERACA